MNRAINRNERALLGYRLEGLKERSSEICHFVGTDALVGNPFHIEIISFPETPEKWLFYRANIHVYNIIYIFQLDH